MRVKILKIHRELEIDGKRVTADAIRDKLYGRDESQKALIGIYLDHNNRCHVLIGKDLTISTVEKFEKVVRIALANEWIKKLLFKHD